MHRNKRAKMYKHNHFVVTKIENCKQLPLHIDSYDTLGYLVLHSYDSCSLCVLDYSDSQ